MSEKWQGHKLYNKQRESMYGKLAVLIPKYNLEFSDEKMLPKEKSTLKKQTKKPHKLWLWNFKLPFEFPTQKCWENYTTWCSLLQLSSLGVEHQQRQKYLSSSVRQMHCSRSQWLTRNPRAILTGFVQDYFFVHLKNTWLWHVGSGTAEPLSVWHAAQTLPQNMLPQGSTNKSQGK